MKPLFVCEPAVFRAYRVQTYVSIREYQACYLGKEPDVQNSEIIVGILVREERVPLNPKSVISVETTLGVAVKAKGFELKQKNQTYTAVSRKVVQTKRTRQCRKVVWEIPNKFQ